MEPSSACVHEVRAPRRTSTVVGAEGTEMTKELSASKEPFGLLGQADGEAAHFHITGGCTWAAVRTQKKGQGPSEGEVVPKMFSKWKNERI